MKFHKTRRDDSLYMCNTLWQIIKKKLQSIKNFGYTIDEEFVHVMGHVHLNCSGYIRSVWYMYLKTENCCLKTFVKIRVGENAYEIA